MSDIPLYTDTQARDMLEEALTALGLLERQIRDLTWKLPTLPVDAAEGAFMEIGYVRQESWNRDVFDPDDLEEGESPPAEIAPVETSCRGWSAMSDEGFACWLEYDGEKYAVPDDMKWS